MRIALDGRIILPRMTGAGRYVLELARRIPALAPRVQLDLLALQGFQSRETVDALEAAGVRIHYCRSPIASVGQWIEIPRVLRQLSPDLYHYPFLDLPFVGCPSVITVYDLNPVLYLEYYDGQRVLRRAIARWLVRSSVHRARLALTISDTTRASLEAVAPEARGKTRTIPLAAALDQGATIATVAPVAEAMGDSRWKARPYVLYIGVDRPHKNLVRLVQAFAAWRAAELWTTGSGPYLWLAGIGDGSARLQAEIRRLECGGDVRRSGPVAESDLAGVYRSARVVAYVSVSEGFGLPLLEGFAARVPVLSSDATALVEIGGDAAHYATGDNVEAVAAGLRRLWHDDTLRAFLVARGIDRLAAYSWDATVRATLRAYEDGLG